VHGAYPHRQTIRPCAHRGSLPASPVDRCADAQERRCDLEARPGPRTCRRRGERSLAQAACRQGYRALCIRAPRLVHQLGIARADGSYAKVLNQLARTHVLVIDDFLIAPMKDTEARDLLEVLDDRYGHTSTVVTTQLATKVWHDALGEPLVADAICDRLVHNAHAISLKGESGRKKNGMTTDPAKTPEAPNP